jgi:hypothetical protein
MRTMTRISRCSTIAALVLAVTGVVLGIGVVGFWPRHVPFMFRLIVSEAIPRGVTRAADYIPIDQDASTESAIRRFDVTQERIFFRHKELPSVSSGIASVRRGIYGPFVDRQPIVWKEVVADDDGGGSTNVLYPDFKIYGASSITDADIHPRSFGIKECVRALLRSLGSYQRRFRLTFNLPQGFPNDKGLSAPHEHEQHVKKPDSIIKPVSVDREIGESSDNDGLLYALGFGASLCLIACGLIRASSGGKVGGFCLVGLGLFLDVLTGVCGMLGCIPWRGCL